MSNVIWSSPDSAPTVRLGSGYRPSAWCHECHGVYPQGGVCECVSERLGGATAFRRLAQRSVAASRAVTEFGQVFGRDAARARDIRRMTWRLLREKYGKGCEECGGPAYARLCFPCAEGLR